MYNELCDRFRRCNLGCFVSSGSRSLADSCVSRLFWNDKSSRVAFSQATYKYKTIQVSNFEISRIW